MNRNLPQHASGAPSNEHANPPRYEPGHGPDADANPYAQRYGTPPPDLDANAPLLKSSEMQRLNRKALIFLAGIVGLLLVMAFWMFSRATAGDDVVAKPRQEKVEIPELPESAEAGLSTQMPATGPIGVEAYEPEAMASELPPLPMEHSPPPSSYSSKYPSDLRASAPPRELTLRERRMTSGDPASVQAPDPYTQALLAGMPGTGANAASGQAPPAVRADASSAQYINNPDALLVRGTYVRCVLETRIVTDIPGFTSCVVTEPIYSINGRRLLLPKGSKISGRYDTEPNGPRVSVVWDRITTPNGIDVNMTSPGVDNLGGAGHPGHYDAHWPARISSALMISLLSDAFKYAGAKNGPRTTTVTNGIVTDHPFESNTARTMERLANQALDQSMGRPATVTINQGTVVNVYVAKDVDFSGVLARR